MMITCPSGGAHAGCNSGHSFGVNRRRKDGSLIGARRQAEAPGSASRGATCTSLHSAHRADQLPWSEALHFISERMPTIDLLVFAALSMDFEVTAEVFVPIRTTRPDKSLHKMQPYEIKLLVAAHSDESTECYTGRKLKFPILYGSI